MPLLVVKKKATPRRKTGFMLLLYKKPKILKGGLGGKPKNEIDQSHLHTNNEVRFHSNERGETGHTKNGEGASTC